MTTGKIIWMAIAVISILLAFLVGSCQPLEINASPTPSQVIWKIVTATPVPNTREPWPTCAPVTCAAETARDIEIFQQIEQDMSFREICQLVRMPDEEVCSGIYCNLYRLNDGRVVVISFVEVDGPAKVAIWPPTP